MSAVRQHHQGGTRTAGGRDSVHGGAVLGGEQLHRRDEGGGVGAKVGKEEGLQAHADSSDQGVDTP